MMVVDDQVLRWTESVDEELIWTDHWEDFKAAFIKRFGRTTHAAWRALLNRSQREKETVRHYGEAVRSLAMESGKSCEDDTVISHFQHHIRDPVKSLLKIQCRPSGLLTICLRLLSTLRRPLWSLEGCSFSTLPLTARTMMSIPGIKGAPDQVLTLQARYITAHGISLTGVMASISTPDIRGKGHSRLFLSMTGMCQISSPSGRTSMLAWKIKDSTLTLTTSCQWTLL